MPGPNPSTMSKQKQDLGKGIRALLETLVLIDQTVKGRRFAESGLAD